VSEYFTPSDPTLQFVVWLSLALLVLVLLLLLQIIVLRISLLSRTAREQRFRNIWQPLLAEAVSGETVTLPRLARVDEITFLKLWNHLQESLRGEAKQRLNDVAVRCGMVPRTHVLLRRKELRLKLLALNTLGHLGDRSAWEEIVQLTHRPDPLLSLAAARALFLIDATAALEALKDEVLEREDWPAAQLAILFQEIGMVRLFIMLAETATRLAEATDAAEKAMLKRLLQLLEVAPYPHVISAIRSILLVTTDDEVVAQCLKYLREPMDIQFARPNLTHPNWVVRLQAARALGRIGSIEDIPELGTLLSDPVWWVRYRTAQALVELVRGDSDILSGLKEKLSDRYARDMLDMVMAEQGA
jgi:HEAT repeat protein